MSTNLAINEDNRSSTLKSSLRRYVNIIAQMNTANPELAKQHQHLFFYLSYPWLVEPEGDAEVEANLVRQQEQFVQLGFDGAKLKQVLEQILNEDQHLKECCSTLLNLAYLLDIEFISYAAVQQNESGISDEQFDHIFKGFSDYIYEQPFKKVAVSHLYNFEAEDDHLIFNGLRVVKLDAGTISIILGEPTNQSFIVTDALVQNYAPAVQDFQLLPTSTA